MHLQEWHVLSTTVLDRVHEHSQAIGICSVDFLQYSAYVMLAGLWLQTADCAHSVLEAESVDADLQRSRLNGTHFRIRPVLPRARSHREALLGGAGG